MQTFVLVSAGWVFFRAASIHDASRIFRHIVTNWQSFLTPERFTYEAARTGWQRWDTIVIVLALLALEIGDTLGLRIPWRQRLGRQPAAFRWCGYYALVLAIALCGQFGGAPFIYFQF